MPETKTTLSLHRKLAQIMYEAERIPKNGIGPREQGSYPFVRAGDAADYIRKALAEKVITMMPTSVQVTGQVDRPLRSGVGVMTTVDLLTEWTLTDGESGETLTIMSFGAGADTGDKYSGKASTSAMKYALLTGFLLSTGDDTENHDTSAQGPRQAPQPPAQRPPADTTHPASVPADADGQNGTEHEEMMGRVSRRGLVKKGTAEGYKLDFRQGPEGHITGFRLEIDGEKNIPQCLVTGPVGEKLYRAYPDLSLIAGKPATVAGLLYNVRRSDKPGSWYRLHVDRFENDDWTLTNEAEPVLPQPPDDVPLVGEAESAPLGLVS